MLAGYVNEDKVVDISLVKGPHGGLTVAGFEVCPRRSMWVPSRMAIASRRRMRFTTFMISSRNIDPKAFVSDVVDGGLSTD